ncbi:LysR family transcriptional regulator [Clostridioides difficile]|nr:LysR family transcriptional regulator [Clostridioides difficile]
MIQFSNKAISKVKKTAGTPNYVLRIGTSLLNPCRTFFKLWKSINERHLEYQLKIVTFEDDHTNILSTIENLGKNIDFFVGTCGSRPWLARCNFYPLGYHYLSIAVPHGHPLVDCISIDLSSLHGNTLMMGRRGDSEFIDKFRDILETEHPQIHIQDTSYYYDVEVFNECEQTGSVLLTLDVWEDVHPSLITIPLTEKFANPYGIIYSQDCTNEMKQFIELIENSITK